MPQAVANRYAQALAEAIGTTSDYPQAARDLESFAQVYRDNAELREVFDSPAVLPEQKLGVLNAILSRLSISGDTGNFLRVLLKNYRINILEEIRQAFQAIADDYLGIAQMSVTSAAPLSDDEKAVVAERFGSITGKQPAIEYRVDDALIGGLVAQVKSTVYDGSVRGALDRIREQMGARPSSA